MDIFARIEGADIDIFLRSVASDSNPFIFAKARPLPKASELPRKERQQWINQKGRKSWEEALKMDRVQPGTVTEWKEKNWGSAQSGKAQISKRKEEVEITFKADRFPRPLFQFLAEENKSLKIVLLGFVAGDINLAVYQDGQEISFWKQGSSLKELASTIRKEKLDDLLQYRLRTSGKIVRGSFKALERGKRVSVLVKGGETLSLQKESFIRPLRADMFLDECSFLDDVLTPEIDGLHFYLDLYA